MSDAVPRQSTDSWACASVAIEVEAHIGPFTDTIAACSVVVPRLPASPSKTTPRQQRVCCPHIPAHCVGHCGVPDFHVDLLRYMTGSARRL